MDSTEEGDPDYKWLHKTQNGWFDVDPPIKKECKEAA